MGEKVVYEVLFVKERRVEVLEDNEDSAWDAAERERSGDELIVNIKKKEKK